MNCDVCGGPVPPDHATRKLMWLERAFCSEACVSFFDQRLFDPHLRPEESFHGGIKGRT